MPASGADGYLDYRFLLRSNKVEFSDTDSEGRERRFRCPLNVIDTEGCGYNMILDDFWLPLVNTAIYGQNGWGDIGSSWRRSSR